MFDEVSRCVYDYIYLNDDTKYLEKYQPETKFSKTILFKIAFQEIFLLLEANLELLFSYDVKQSRRLSFNVPKSYC